MSDVPSNAGATPKPGLNQDFPLIFERSRPGRRAAHPPKVNDVDLAELLGKENLRQEPPRLPEVSELDLVRHYTQLAHRQMSIDSNFYPLGSCTMKYNPKVNEELASLRGFQAIHPLQPTSTAQGALHVIYETNRMLSELTGMYAYSLNTFAGAHGELAGLMIMRAYHDKNKDFNRQTIIVPDSAHGTNFASASVAGFNVVEIKSNDDGTVNIEALKAALND